MSIKLASVVILFAATAYSQQHGGLGQYASTGHKQVQYQQPKQYHHQPEPYDDHPKYEYAYKVEDKHTGDYKEQHESRDGDVVKGFYWLLDADGYRRLVEYTVEGKSGFQAKVTREPTGHAPVPARAPVHKQAHVPKYAPAPIRVVAPAPIRAPAPIHPPAHQ